MVPPQGRMRHESIVSHFQVLAVKLHKVQAKEHIGPVFEILLLGERLLKHHPLLHENHMAPPVAKTVALRFGSL